MDNSVVETPEPLKESPFTFDVWQCLNCDWAISDSQYTAIIVNLRCPGCGKAPLSEFGFRKARNKEKNIGNTS